MHPVAANLMIIIIHLYNAVASKALISGKNYIATAR